MSNGNTRIMRALLWHQEGIAHLQRGDMAKARHLLMNAIEVFRKEKDEKSLAGSLSQLSQVYYAEEDLTKATKCVFESAMIRTRIKDLRGLSIDYQTMGNLLMTVGQLGEAEGYFKDSLGLATGLKDDILIASAESNLGILYWYRDDYSTARVHLERSQKIRKRLNDNLGIAKNLNHLGKIEEETGNKKSAKKLYKKSLAILRRLGAPEAKIALDNLRRLGV